MTVVIERGKLKVSVFRLEARVRCAHCGVTRYRQAQTEPEFVPLFKGEGWAQSGEPPLWVCKRCYAGLTVEPEVLGNLVPVETAMAEVKGMANLKGYGRNYDLPIVAGHQLSPQEHVAFHVWYRTGDKQAAADAAKITRTRFNSWKKSAWWDALWRERFAERNMDLERDLTEADDVALDAYRGILAGERSGDKSVNAQALLIGKRLAIGSRPIEIKRPDVQITNTKVEIAGNVNIAMLSKSLDGLSEEDLLAVATGAKPLPEG